MESHKIFKSYKFVFPQFDRAEILLVGCGGTGSFIAQALARIAYHLKQRGLKLSISLIDPDRVEEKNIGRQNFCPADIGKNKAETLAARYNFAYGLDFKAIPVRFARNIEIPREDPVNYSYERQDLKLVIGAVDTVEARLEIEKYVLSHNCWWIDSGNSELGGQVLIGNQGSGSQFIDPLGVCHGLPYPSLQAPGLTRRPRNNAPQPISCADLLARDEQSFFVNQTAATVASNYLYQILFRRELTHFSVNFDLGAISSRAEPITRQGLAPFQVRVRARAA